MKLFDVPEAQHYCRGFGRPAASADASLRQYVAATLKTKSSLKEGSPDFSNYRDCALRDVERCLLLAVSHYRRSLDLMRPAASSWAHVTLYYSSYFAAHAIIGLFGGWIGGNLLIEVSTSAPGHQELTINRKPQSQTTYRGSHERFWDLFYGSVAALTPWVDARLSFAIAPVSGQVTWLTSTRNDVNYDSFVACQLASQFQGAFQPASFPASLPGSLNTQFSITEGLLLIAVKFMRDLRLRTDALNLLGPVGPRRRKIQRLVFGAKAPRLVEKTKWRSVLF